ncbi:MAG TPA: YciI family protein [Solirubrobacteraceae bacterium]|nr:YciI family protein [Solirubrobacteraceae bacterium]
MEYPITLHYRPGEGPQEGTPEFDAEMERWRELNEEMRRAGVLVALSGLRPEAVTTVRERDGHVSITDGPYAETKEILFSFYILDVADLDAATAWAAKMPSAAYGSNEIRPTMGFEVA